MANSNSTITIDMSYTGPGGSAVTAPRKTIAAPYQGMNSGRIDVPALETSATEHVIPFGGVAAATCVRVDNNTDARITLKINAEAAASHALPPGGTQLIAMPVADVGTTPAPLTSVTAILGEAATLGGTIDYWVFGDPV